MKNARIAKIEPLFLRYPFPAPIRYVYSGGVVDNMDAAYVRVMTEDGEYGLGEITHGQFCHEPIIGLVQHFDRLLKGRPVADINLLCDLMYQSSIFWNRQGVGIGVMGGIATSDFTEGARIASLAGLHRKPVAIHSWGTIVSCLAGVHMALSTPECVMTEYCFMDHPLNDLISVKPFRPMDGFATALDAPGLGVSFDDALLNDYPYDPSINTMISTAEQHFEF